MLFRSPPEPSCSFSAVALNGGLFTPFFLQLRSEVVVCSMLDWSFSPVFWTQLPRSVRCLAPVASFPRHNQSSLRTRARGPRPVFDSVTPSRRSANSNSAFQANRIKQKSTSAPSPPRTAVPTPPPHSQHYSSPPLALRTPSPSPTSRYSPATVPQGALAVAS